jgi:hypothetical protein
MHTVRHAICWLPSSQKWILKAVGVDVGDATKEALFTDSAQPNMQFSPGLLKMVLFRHCPVCPTRY